MGTTMKRRKHESKREKKVIVVLPDGSPLDPKDQVPPHIAEDIRDRHLHPEKYRRPSLNELLGPSEEDKQRKRAQLEMLAFRKRKEQQAARALAEEARKKIEVHQQQVLSSISLDLENDVDLTE